MPEPFLNDAGTIPGPCLEPCRAVTGTMPDGYRSWFEPCRQRGPRINQRISSEYSRRICGELPELYRRTTGTLPDLYQRITGTLPEFYSTPGGAGTSCRRLWVPRPSASRLDPGYIPTGVFIKWARPHYRKFDGSEKTCCHS